MPPSSDGPALGSADPGGAAQVRRMRLLAGLILLTGLLVFSVNVWRMSSRQVDDACISYRYARHLAEGHGLTWNPGGEPVEGFTSMLHVLVLSLGFLLDLRPEGFSIAVGVAAALGTAVLMLRLLRRLAGPLHPVGAVFVAAYLADWTAPTHATTGLETHLFAVLVLATYAAALPFLRAAGPRDALVLAGCVVLAVLCRPEGLLYAAAILGVVAERVLAGRRRDPAARESLRFLGLAIALAAALGAAYAAGKLSYFGYLLPNPFYVKSGALSLEGLEPVLLYLRHVTGLLVLPLLAVVALSSPRRVAFALASGTLGTRIAAAFAPVPLILGYYLTIEHNVGIAHRFSYPTFPLLVLIAAIVSTFAVRSTTAARGRALAAAACVVGLGALAVVGYRHEWRPAVRPRPPLVTQQRAVGEALRSTGLGQDATVICVAAGAIPYLSGFDHVDPIGLNDNYLSGRDNPTREERESYLWAARADLYLGYEPPASPGANDPDEDPRMRTPYVTDLLQNRRGRIRLMRERVFPDGPGPMHRRMRELRDNWELVGELDWPGWRYWRLKQFAYVRKGGPHSAVLLEALRPLLIDGHDAIDVVSVD